MRTPFITSRCLVSVKGLYFVYVATILFNLSFLTDKFCNVMFSLTGAWYTLKQNIADNANEIEHIKESLIEYEKLLDERVSRLEKYKEQELEEVNKSLLSKVLGRDE